MQKNTGEIIIAHDKNNSRQVFLNVPFYYHLDINLSTQRWASDFNVLYSNSKPAAVNFSFIVLRLVVKVKKLSLIGNRVECWLTLSFGITADNLGCSRSQANSTKSLHYSSNLHFYKDIEKIRKKRNLEPLGKSAGRKINILKLPALPMLV